MNQFITIANFQYPHQAHIIQSKLEAAGIEVFLKDELTVQSHNFLSNAVGGVKLQVKASDAEEAIKLLKEMGINVEPLEESKGYWDWIDAKTDNLPILKNLPVELRAIILTALILIPLLSLVYYLQLPEKKEKINPLAERAKTGIHYELESKHLPTIDSLLKKSPTQAISYTVNLLEGNYQNNRKLYFKLAKGYIDIDSFSRAKYYIESSLDFNYPENEKLAALAYCYFQLRNYEAAIEIYQDLKFSNEKYKVALAEAYARTGDYKNALIYYSDYIDARREKDSDSYKDKFLFEVILKRDSIKNLIKE